MQRQTINESSRDSSELQRRDVQAELFADSEVAPGSWQAAGPLIDHIISNYHRPSVHLLSKLRRCICDAVECAGAKPCDQLRALKACHGELQLDLAHQMMKEEIRLFPRLRRYEGGRCDSIEQNGSLEIAALVRAARADHRKTLDLLTQIGEIVPGSDGQERGPVAEIRTMFAQIDKQVRRRIHLQDEVLFPLIERYSRPPRA